MKRRPPFGFILAKRMLTAGIAVVLALQFSFPLAARAENSPDMSKIVIPPLVPSTPVFIVGNVYEEVKKQLNSFGDQLITGGVFALFNAFQVFSQRIAYDAAQRILTGDAGQAPLFWEEGFGDYLESVTLDAGNQFISSINSEVFNPLGYDLCTPIDPLKLQLSFGVKPIDQLKATCDFAKIGSAWEQTKDAITDTKDVFDNIAPMYDPASSELNVGIGFHQKYLDAQARNETAAELDRKETQGLKQIQDAISGNIKTPTQVAKDTIAATNAVSMKLANYELNAMQMATIAFKVGFTQLGIMTASTFLNTLAVGLLDKLFKGMTGSSVDVKSVDLVNSESVSNSNVARARIVFSDLLTPNLYSSAQQDFVNEFVSCPTPRGIWHCAMDDAFATALRSVGEDGAYTVGRASHVVLNGAPPSNPEFLHQDWELIPESEAKDNTDPSCYQRAYCASNLTKLRYARILPVGWEIAANSPYNTKKNGKYVTLGEAIRGFTVCNEKDEADSSHPWCNLVDPNWVLTAPPFQCKVKGFADTVFPGTQIRLQDCADAVSCLKRDDKGKCTGGYGYCLAEKPTWRFTADACLERFASCRTYTTRSSEMVSYLRNTIDYGSCSKENVGCQWYANQRDPSDKNGNVWLGEYAATSGPRVYFDATAKTCSAGSDGCTKLYQVQLNTPSLNLVPNSSFEKTDANEGVVSKLFDWDFLLKKIKPKYAFPDPDEGINAVQGSNSYEPFSSDELFSPLIAIAPVRNYTLGAYVRNVDKTKDGNIALVLSLSQDKYLFTPVVAGKFFRSEGCTSPAKATAPGFDQKIASGDKSIDWQRIECSFVSNVGTASGRIGILGTNVLVDSIQLEETEKATAYVDGVASGLKEKHLKVSPEEFSCKGAKTDPAICSNYARVCQQSDQGCQGYRDVNNPTAPEIPASLSAVDFCPAVCVGYAEYRKQPAPFDLGKSTNEFLNDPQDVTVAHFVPAYARQCSLKDVGCEEFTNVETAAAGGEGKAYFNYVRACEKPNDNTETYFTWEGSDTTGYQLRTWSLIHDAAAPAPFPPKIVQKAGQDGILKNPKSCNAAYWQTGADTDCRQLFNANGDAFYAYFSQTVVSTPECTDYRMNKSSVADCGKTGGSYDPQSGECIYRIQASASRTCSAVAAGCRAYIGTTGRNTTEVFSEDFRTTSTAKFTKGDLSNESILVGDKSLKITDTGILSTETIFPSFPNQLYSVTFWAKTTSSSQDTSAIVVDGNVIGNFQAQVDWRRYEFGPFSTASTAPTSSIKFAELPNATFLDSIRIERLNDVSYIVKDSWAVPAECDRTPEGLPQPQAMLGCRAYSDRDQNNVTVRRFGHLCREEAISCKAFVDTRNSENPYEQTFELPGTDLNAKTTTSSKQWEDQYLGTATTKRPADRFVYLIDDLQAQCSASEDSCRAFGKPKYKQDYLSLESASTSKFETVYFIDDITKYVANDGEPDMLCRKDELYCDEFKSGKITAYFRNPADHACEWKDKVLLKKNEDKGIPADGEYTGWFRKGTDAPCYPSVLSTGNTYLIQNSGDPGYTGWGGLCPIEQSECTEFRDPNDHSDPTHPSGKPYFFIHNQRLDVKSCNGKVDLLSGCILFRDMGDVRLRYSVPATYAKSHAEGDIPETPIDCVTDPDNDFCRKCTDLKYVFNSYDENSFAFVTCANTDFPDDIVPVWFDEKSADLKVGKPALCEFALTLPCDEKNQNSVQCWLQNQYPDFAAAKKKFDEKVCGNDDSCSVSVGNVSTAGKCTKAAVENDANVIMKVKLDRDCAQWLGCATAETVFDPVQQKYTDVCMETAMCDVSKGSNAGTFCANYVDRTKDPILRPGAFFSSEIYTKRKSGFGTLDYSGYAIPDQFQAADIQNRKVGKELFANTPSLANKFAQDYRLAAAVSEKTGMVIFPKDENVPADPLYPNLLICKHRQTGRTGYFNRGGTKGMRVCYFPIDALSTRSADAIIDPSKNEADPRNIQQLSDTLKQSVDPKIDLTLLRSFPPAECKAYPETDSPFPNYYVKEWDYTKDPFKKSKTADGYEAANYCEWGEDCACSYRKVKYGGQATKFVSPFGQAPPSGICSGGDKDGEKCVPGVIATTNAAGEQQVQAAVEDPGCPRGRCVEISDVILVRGQFGQCLQRDYARSVAGEAGRHPCLIWNPNPILASYYDTAHFVPTAGYMPPVNAGEYYCLSPANPPFENNWTMQSQVYWDDSKVKGDVSTGDGKGDGANQFFFLPGSLSKFNYDTGYIAGQCHNSDTCGAGESDCTCHDGSSNITAKDRDFDDVIRAAEKGIGNAKSTVSANCDYEKSKVDPINSSCDEVWRFTNLGQGIDGVKPWNGEESYQAYRCMVAHTGESDSASSGGPPGSGGDKDGIGAWDRPPDSDYNFGRWIQTGRGIGRTYMEYFIAVKPLGVARWLFPEATEDELKAAKENALKERNFSQFQFFPKADAFSAACSLPPEYADAGSVTDWGDSAQVTAASKTVLSNFNRDFKGTLDRSNEGILTDDKGIPIKLPCSGYNNPGDSPGDKTPPVWSGSDPGCYYKYWETNYRLAEGSKFEWLNTNKSSSFFERRKDYYSRERNCSKSGFAIRAMFENTDKSQNDLTVEEVNKGKLNGPWNFVGFWVTACTVGTNYESFLYLGLKVKHADICRQLAQVISPHTRESTAFADRVWNKGTFALPILGYSYVSNYSPFGSALAQGEPGVEPLFQTGQPTENYSKLKPPTFLGSGVSFNSTRLSPLQNWSYLTNIFARVYRVYTYYDAGVPIDGYACIGGVSDGMSCPAPRYQNDLLWDARWKRVCGGVGLCNNGLVSVQVKNKLGRCNALSGVNSGLECGSNVEKVTYDPVCHNAPMKNVDGVLIPQYTKCEIRSNWSQCKNKNFIKKKNPTVDDCSKGALDIITAHEPNNAFGCGSDAVEPGASCTQPDGNSRDCPLRIDEGTLDCIPDDFGANVGYCSGGYEHSRCIKKEDCVFTISQWWGGFDDQHLVDSGGQKSLQVKGFDKNTQTVTYMNAPVELTQVTLSKNVTKGCSAKDTTMSCIQRVVLATGLTGDFALAYQLRNGRIGNMTANSYLQKKWPAPHTYASDPGTKNYIVPGLCEGPEGASQDPNNLLNNSSVAAYGDSTGYGGRAAYAFQAGQCEGGIREGQSCFTSSTTGIVNGKTSDEWPHPNTCAPPKGTTVGTCKNVTQTSKSFDPINGQTPLTPDCVFAETGTGNPFSDDPDLDNNACTRSAGYKPRKDLCGQNLDNEKCLIGYDLRTGSMQSSLNQAQSLAPTDVTSGFHNPIFLGSTVGSPYDYQHIAYYAPRPPTIAAPDLSRSCESPGQCRISKIGGFTLENQAEGSVSFGGGKAQVSMRFYGWAAHDQTPLKNVYVDWGDGTITKVEEARIKNHKPFCGGTRECELAPGLTCNSDSDCPPASGKCMDVGTCGQNPNIQCVRDQDCAVGGKKSDKCNIRQFFGNSEDACEANYFEFGHAYACNPQKLPLCDASKHCSRNPDIACTNANVGTVCGVGDKCLADLAPSSVEGGVGGCYDSTKVACRFTPKLMLKDSWNWCTGECRAGAMVGDSLSDSTDPLNPTLVKHLYGGCWDGTETKRNTDKKLEELIMDGGMGKNECRLERITKEEIDKKIKTEQPYYRNIRPWIVYPGSVQVGTYK